MTFRPTHRPAVLSVFRKNRSGESPGGGSIVRFVDVDEEFLVVDSERGQALKDRGLWIG